MSNEKNAAQIEAIAQADAETNNAGLPSYSELLAQHEYQQGREKADEEKIQRAKEQASAQMDSIAEMVAALECDYDRLEELRDERETLQEAVFDALDTLDNALATVGIFTDNGRIITDADEEKQIIDTRIEKACEALHDAESDLYSFGQNEADELAELETAAGDCENEDEARERIDEDPLSIEVRTGWYSPGDEPQAEEFTILLCTGGPAVRIVGELDQYKQPSRAWLEYQDWFTPWIEYHGDNVNTDALLAYCQQFYFGE